MAIQRIDMHTHVFNVRYLPLEGIIRSRGIPDLIAKGLAKLLNSRTGDDIEPAATPAGMAAAADVERVTAFQAETADEAVAALAAGTPKEAADDPDVRLALEDMRRVAAGEFRAMEMDHVETAGVQAQFAALYQQLDNMQASAGIFESGSEYLRWFQFLTHSERVIMQTLLDTYGDDVHLFIHHMMDMEAYYKHGRCYYDFVTDQLPRMRRLVNAHGGRLLTFVAYSPERANDLNIVRRALDDTDAVGVKFYPPNGYQPDEARHDALYRELVNRDAPLFAHCTPVGMEAKPGSGANSNPAYWERVLNRFPSLRLCLGHAGGDEPWFGRIPWETSYAAKAVDLAVRFDNVYVEFGYHDDILDPAVRDKFIVRLAGLLAATPKLAKKIMYGTDWHMIEKISKHQEYFRAFAAAFADARLAPYADAFFYTNAVAYLRLPEFRNSRLDLNGPDDPVVQNLDRVIEVANQKEIENP
ncbi:MAG TPA: amidohydrolase family protein [Thermoanaerobaculia bacterium]|jgi:predicted TIM-barrel fold metal-dependent hydrolase|nr:amidohydrolase family protein [Thermoanaerobaculia bacterium]